MAERVSSPGRALPRDVLGAGPARTGVLTSSGASNRQASRYRAYSLAQLRPRLRAAGIPPDELRAMDAVAAVFPFRVSEHVLTEIIDWDAVPEDPIFRLLFPQRGMLAPDDLRHVMDLLERRAPPWAVNDAVRTIHGRLNPHPGGQLDLNAAYLDGERLPGVQHKYRQTVLFFPSSGQTCHSYCTYCFRWPQFVRDIDLRMAAKDSVKLVHYLLRCPDVSDVLITGGDPLIMRARELERFLSPLLASEVASVETIRIGTKALAYWPQRVVSDRDADELLRLFERVRAAGKQLAIMAHFSHPRELEPTVVEVAVRRLQDAGARIYCQAPIVRHVNDSPAAWEQLWRTELRLGCVPYYMFVERDTGARRHFELPLVEAHAVFTEAYSRLPGLARTVRGPVMSTTAGKVVIDGIARRRGERVFVLRFLQGRDDRLVNRPFCAPFDPSATWLTDLVPDRLELGG